jgi:branched-chain amino acid transport system ATP-binding protein
MSILADRPLLEIHGLRSGYGRIRILDGVELSVGEGRILGILGHNGMGKTTLLRTLIGQLKATEGEIVFAGSDIARRKPYERARLGLGYVPQRREIFPELTALENLKMGMARRGDDRILEEILGYFPSLVPLLNRPGKGLSGGQQQLLALARCLAGKPKLLMLDEPTEGIQPSIIEEIADLLPVLRDKLGLTVLLVEQDLNFISAVANEVSIIQKGRIVRQLDPRELSNQDLVNAYLGV